MAKNIHIDIQCRNIVLKIHVIPVQKIFQNKENISKLFHIFN